MQTIDAKQFAAQCVSLLDAVKHSGQPLLVMRNGRPLAELRPCGRIRVASPFGLHAGQTRILGDIVAPSEGDSWEALD